MNHLLELIEGTVSEPGGYAIDGRQYRGEDAEHLVDEAKQIAAATGRSWKVALLAIVPANQLPGP